MPTTRRAKQIAALYAAEHDHLTNLVTRRLRNVDAQTIEDACSFAWMQILRKPTVSLDGPRHSIMGWLTLVAERQAWTLVKRQQRSVGVDDEHQLEVASIDTGEFVPSSEQLALLRERLDLVRQLPERPRRFLLRLMVGYSYSDIAAAEDVSYRIVNRQVARAKRLLRQLDEDYRA